MTQHQINLVKSSWQAAASKSVLVGEFFYSRLFELAPETKDLFGVTVLQQSNKLAVMLSYIINKLDKLDDIIDEVAKLARQHVSYGVTPEHYALGGGIFLWSLEKVFGDSWNEELKDAWETCYITLTDAMIQAADYSRQDAA
ncbi:MAG TPA: globin domain-containing protein [Chitinophagaceae bacterium]|jgi:hemoglobin-like flavoprotein|nr:globin domain-containing protein [Chitinophagaceae bacterium]